ncbi:hypothetical protein P8625_09725 [Tenacibaculum tangerinum]|uniref:Lipoprotein n=1 Tax=Tenacibaculum tangerinum TaxID=3038772 RepID=A0ABY8KZD2_9FLAO|nr:hypothetical protein [Tenacibaculum tangerinum]WGH74389.1 hypothetical protein P8625_09725 [Tenacibaculum tangerinum]
MKIKILKTVLLFAVIIFFNCSNNDDSIEQDQLPPITQTGANTFGCVINGEVLVPKDAINYPPGPIPRGLKVYYQNNILTIDAGNLADDNGNRVYIYINGINSTGSFELNNAEYTANNFTPNYSYLWVRENNNDIDKIYLSKTTTGSINISRFDSVNNIVSGNFDNLNIVNKDNTNESITLTNGRFDFNLNTVNN